MGNILRFKINFCAIFLVFISFVFLFNAPALAKKTKDKAPAANAPLTNTDALEGDFNFYTPQSQGDKDKFCKLNCSSDAKPIACYQSCVSKNMTSQKADEPDPQICISKMEQLKSACNVGAQEAQNSCDDTKDSGMNSAQQAIGGLGQQLSSSVKGACSTMGMISAAANAAMSAYQMNCQNSIENCWTACDAAVNYYMAKNGCFLGIDASIANGDPVLVSMNNSKRACRALTAKSDQAKVGMQNLMTTLGQANKCSNSVNGTGVLIPEICKTNPTMPGCSNLGNIDCSRPELASDKVCVCSRNPNNPICMSGNNAGSILPPGGGPSDPYKDKGKIGSDAFSGGDLNGLPDIVPGKVSSGSNDPAIDGRQGKGAMLGGEDAKSAAAAGGGHGGGEKETDPTKVNAGFYSGGGGGSFGGGSGGAGGGAYGGYDSGNGKMPNGDPNLRQFLPGGAFDPRSRGLAGASGGGGLDGITGPNTDIWRKIQNRYNVVSPTLMP